MRTFYEKFENWFKKTLYIIGGCFFACGPLILIWQAYTWLKDGEWISLQFGIVFTFIIPLESFWQWYNYPESWLGVSKLVHDLFEQTPLTLGLIILALLLLWWATSMDEKNAN